MNSFLKSKVGLVSIAAFTLLMAFVFLRVLNQRKSRAAAAAGGHTNAPSASIPAPAAKPAVSANTTPPSAVVAPEPEHPGTIHTVAENAAYLDQYYRLDSRTREDRDRVGNPVTRRENATTPNDAARVALEDVALSPAGPPVRNSLRLQGKPAPLPRGDNLTSPLKTTLDILAGAISGGKKAAAAMEPISAAATKTQGGRPKRFNPYGSVVRCELVFTIDSTNEQTPFIGVVTEPVYNNGALIIPSGTELHGVARPDRLRDRIFSGDSWVLVFPREQNQPNGRQLTVKGVVLDRIEPDANGVTWGITDGSYGLEGTLIRTMQQEEIKRFATTFFSEAAQTLQDRQSDRGNHETIKNTPENAVLQGLSANLQKMADDISAEIARHGVFIRVPAGHQFYFYPMQVIDPDAADVSSEIAFAK